MATTGGSDAVTGGSAPSGGTGADAGAGSSAGGHAGVGGGRSDSGAAGAGEAGAISVADGACLPQALAELVAPCPFTEGCTYATTDAGFIDVCYENGVKTEVARLLGTSTTSVKSADESICYLLDNTTNGTATRYDYVWKDAAMTIVATGRIEASSADIAIVKVDGTRYRVDLASESCRGVSALPRGTERCELGSCSF